MVNLISHTFFILCQLSIQENSEREKPVSVLRQIIIYFNSCVKMVNFTGEVYIKVLVLIYDAWIKIRIVHSLFGNINTILQLMFKFCIFPTFN